MIENIKQWFKGYMLRAVDFECMERNLKTYQKMVDDLQQSHLEKTKVFTDEVEKLQNEIEELKTGKFKGHNDAVAVDFQNPNIAIVSIERAWHDEHNLPETLIGYLDNQGIMQEWYLPVSDDKHAALVLEFQTSLTTKRMKGK